MEATLPPPSTTTPSKVSGSTIESAVTSLLKWKTQKTQTQNPQLLESDEFIYLVLTLHKIPPKSRTNAYKIPLKNPIYTPQQDPQFCLFLDDRHHDSKTAKDKILAENIPISKTIKFSKLKTDYKPFEAKRKLCDSYDMFFADKRIIPLLPKAIGKEFYRKKKIPVPIELGRGNWKEQVERVCGSALFYVSTGSCSVLRVARVSMSKDEIVENVSGVIDGVVEFVSKKWRNVRSLHLKLGDSVALPVYQAVPEIKMKFGNGIAVGEDNEGEVSESEKSGKKSKVGGKKKGRIHEVRYMDDAMVGGEDLGSDGEDDDDEEEMRSVEVVVGKKRKNASGEKKGVKKVAKVVKNKKDKVFDSEIGSDEIAVEKVKKVAKGLKKNKKEKVLDSEKKVTAVEKVKKGVKDTIKVKTDVGLKPKKDKVLVKSSAEKKTKRSKVAV